MSSFKPKFQEGDTVRLKQSSEIGIVRTIPHYANNLIYEVEFKHNDYPQSVYESMIELADRWDQLIYDK